MFPCFLKSLGAKNTVKTRIFWRLASPKPRYLRCFLLLVPKTTAFTVFLWPAPCKNSGIYTVFSVLQEVLFPCQKPKNTVNYSVLAFDTRWKTSEKRQKTTKSVQNGASLSGPKNQANGRSVFELSPARLRPHLSKTDRFRASPSPTPPRLASLRFAYTYTQAQAFGWLSW